jgi:hypothetical protein
VPAEDQGLPRALTIGIVILVSLVWAAVTLTNLSRGVPQDLGTHGVFMSLVGTSVLADRRAAKRGADPGKHTVGTAETPPTTELQVITHSDDKREDPP